MSNNSEEKDPIDSLHERLYKRDGQDMDIKVSRLPKREPYIGSDWKEEMKKRTRKINTTSLFNKLLVVGVVFFLGSLSFAAFTILRGGNVVSGGNIELNVEGPRIIKAGDESSFVVSVGNRNNIDLETVEVSVEYPEGTRNSKDLTNELLRDRERLGIVKQGEVVNRTFRAAIFGEADSEKEVVVSIEYRVAGSNAIFDKKVIHKILIGSAPLSLKVDIPEEVNSGQEISIDVNVSADSETTLKNLALKGSFPSGFEFIKSTPPPTDNDNFWSIGDMSPGDKKIIRITGKINGQDDEAKTVRFEVGQAKPNDSEIGVVYNSVLSGVEVKRPFVVLNMSFEGNSSNEVSFSGGQTVKGNVAFANNTSDRIVDGIVEIKITGNAIDKTSVIAGNGFYRSSDSTIIWDFKNTGSLIALSSGQSEALEFSFRVVSVDSSGKVILNPNLKLSAEFRGKKDGQSNYSINSMDEKQIKVTSAIQLATVAVHSTGPFKNYGPLPPVVDQETSYTVTWSVVNPSNDLKNAYATSILPSYVKWLGATSPSGENISFNPNTGEVRWNLGDVSAGVGFTRQAREASFQVGITPSLSQQGKEVVLTGEVRLSAFDSFANSNTNLSKGGLSTKIVNDPIYVKDMEFVQ